jgi:KDO2-lipid IV(A) lauroyltransferase
MDSKKLIKNISYVTSWLGLHVGSLIIKAIPEQWLYQFAGVLARLTYRLAVKQRKIALQSLSIAFGGKKSPAQIEQIAKNCFIAMAKSGVEVAFLIDRPELLRKRIRFENAHYLQEALSRKKGVILVSAHFGNFPLLLAKVSLEGYSIAGIMRTMRDRRAEEFFLEKRKRLKIKVIYSQPRKVCVERSIQALRNNEVLFILLDQHFGSGGVMVDFFGKKAATATGPVVLAQRTGATILPCFMVRQKDDTNKLIFEPPFILEKRPTDEETVFCNIQSLTAIIEAYIRRYPAEWGWIHRRWKGEMKT